MGDALDAYVLGTFLYDEGGELAERSFSFHSPTMAAPYGPDPLP